MKFDPVELAREMEIAYATDYIGDRNILFASILSRFGDPAVSLREKLPEFIKMRGPYIQALPVPKWSKAKWVEFAPSVKSIYAPKGIDSHIIDLFAKTIKELYTFQEIATQTILDDRNTLIVAGTGRGKTESWLIPLLHWTLMAKQGEIAGHAPRSVKALLVYPTKALTQDQLKRLIKYLFELNKNLPESERVTIGVYDGDTPSLSDANHLTYLTHAFRYFKCPQFDSEKALCRSCKENNDASLIVLKGEKPFPQVYVPTPECREKIPLDFIHLTRDDIKDARVDILLTNPDTINLRLVNINADQERGIFIKEPKFIVLDEIHTLNGLFGSFVSLMMKRLLLVRKELLNKEVDDLRILAASATISNKEEIFGKIVPFGEDFAVIEEEYEQIKKDLPKSIPSFLLDSQFTKEDLIAEARKHFQKGSVREPFASLFKALKLDNYKPDSIESEEDVEGFVGEGMFESLTTEFDKESDLDVIKALHSELLSRARTPIELLKDLTEHYPRLDENSLQRLIQNFFTIGESSGILENRVHLFSWPLDGYYSCINCGRIYENPQGECEKCHHHFVSRITQCRICDEEATESWFCPVCKKVYALLANVEGRPTFFDPHKCNCTGSETECIKVVWRPYFRCTKCGRTIQKSYIDRCDKCGSRMLIDETGTKAVCTNGECSASRTPKSTRHCPHCNSDLELMAKEGAECPRCGKKTDAGMHNICGCGAAMHPVLYLPWICDNENCTEVITTERPPASCKCGSKKFFVSGLFDFTYAYYCRECKHYFAIPSCGNPRHNLELQRPDFKEYRLIDENFEIQKATKCRRASPCYHPRKRYGRKRFLPYTRSHENVAVTCAQHALRKMIDHSTLADMSTHLKRAKILSFSDSHNDMERLNRSFQEPEQQWFIDQLVISALDKGQKTLYDLYDAVIKEFDQRQDLYPRYVDLSRRVGTRREQLSHDKNTLLMNEVDKRILGGYFQGSYEIDRLVCHGLVDIELDLDNCPTMNKDEILLLDSLYDRRSWEVGQLVKKLEPELQESFDDVLRRLEANKLVIEEKGRLRISPKRILCTLVSREHPIAFDPKNDNFCPTLLMQLGKNPPSCIQFDKKYTERADIFRPGFSKTAFRIGYSTPVMMLSEAYKGTTDKTVRRELEFQFKNGIYPNFLSSGPAMELGIDIGDLDILCLYGTPPNINSYLQRTGRAGRASKKSLVFSVSKRNPIDFYYYRNPGELIQSKPQPIPLNEHNPEVLKVSLAWALFDFLATRFWIPWRSVRAPDGIHITDGEEAIEKEATTTKPDDIRDFTAIYWSKNKDLDFGRRLSILDKLINERRDEAKSWLEEILNYSFCPRCGKHYPAIYEGNCKSVGCSEVVVRAKDRYADLVEDALNSFGTHFISLGEDFHKELRLQRRKLEDEGRVIEDKLDSNDPIDEAEKQRCNLLLKSIEERKYQLHRLEDQTSQMEYAKFHRWTKEKKYAFDIRTFEEEVEIVYFKEEPQTEGFKPVIEGRGIQMALKEAHPYAVTTVDRQKRVACRVFFDERRRSDIQEVYPDQLICASCFKIYSDLGTRRCDCGGDLRLLETHVPQRIEVYPASYPLRENIETGRGLLNPLDIHASAEPRNTVKSTLPALETEVIDFKPNISWDFKDNNGNKIGTMEYGEINLATCVESYVSTYENGLVDRAPRYLELCSVNDCNSIVSQHGNHVCCMDCNHDPNSKKYVRLAYMYKTYGIRLSTTEDDEVIAHTLAHGTRVGLQSIAGVHIRNIGEVVQDKYAYVYDSEPGGSGITTLLTTIEGGEFKNFKYAIKLFYDHLSACKCDDGCPHCIFQFGCAEGNDPKSISRRRTKQWMDNGVNVVETSTRQS